MFCKHYSHRTNNFLDHNHRYEMRIKRNCISSTMQNAHSKYVCKIHFTIATINNENYREQFATIKFDTYQFHSFRAYFRQIINSTGKCMLHVERTMSISINSWCNLTFLLLNTLAVFLFVALSPSVLPFPHFYACSSLAQAQYNDSFLILLLLSMILMVAMRYWDGSWIFERAQTSTQTILGLKTHYRNYNIRSFYQKNDFFLCSLFYFNFMFYHPSLPLALSLTWSPFISYTMQLKSSTFGRHCLFFTFNVLFVMCFICFQCSFVWWNQPIHTFGIRYAVEKSFDSIQSLVG